MGIIVAATITEEAIELIGKEATQFQLKTFRDW